jgi:hypothetical protein
MRQAGSRHRTALLGHAERRWRGHHEVDPSREEYLDLRARVTCLEHAVAAFAASLTHSVDHAALAAIMDDGTRRYSGRCPEGFAPSLPQEERERQWARVSQEFAELRSLIQDLSSFEPDTVEPRAALLTGSAYRAGVGMVTRVLHRAERAAHALKAAFGRAFVSH